MAPVEDVEVVVAHNERATLRVGNVFLKIDADQTRTDVEVEAMAMAPIPTPEVLWRKPPVLALAAPQARHSAASASRRPRPRRRGPQQVPPYGCCTTRTCRYGPVGASTRSHRNSTANEWLVANGVLPTDLVGRRAITHVSTDHGRLANSSLS